MQRNTVKILLFTFKVHLLQRDQSMSLDHMIIPYGQSQKFHRMETGSYGGEWQSMKGIIKMQSLFVSKFVYKMYCKQVYQNSYNSYKSVKDELLYAYTYMVAVTETYLSSSPMLISPFCPLERESERNSQIACLPFSGWNVPRNLHMTKSQKPNKCL